MSQRNAQLTRTGYDRLVAELAELKRQRVVVIEDVKTAREYGDLKENGEYHAAREAYGFLEGKIQALEAKLAGAEILDDSALDEVIPGVVVTVRNENSGELLRYTFVDVAEIDYVENGISLEAPLAEALLYLRVGDDTEVETPRGTITYTVVAIGD